MAMTATLVQATSPVMGQPTTYVLTVFNSSGAQVNVNSIQPTVTSPNGASPPSLPFNLGAVVAPGSQPSVAQVGGSQFNVPVPATGNTVFTFPVSFFGPAVNGTPAQPLSQFVVGATIQTSDASVFTPPPLTIELNAPTFGQPGSPPNLVPLVGQVNFSSPMNSALVF